MIGKIKSILLGVLCAVCLQAPLNVGAVELPIVPVEESQAEKTTAVSETPAVTQKPAEQETPVITEAPATKKAAETTKASASENSTPPSDAAVSEPPASETAKQTSCPSCHLTVRVPQKRKKAALIVLFQTKKTAPIRRQRRTLAARTLRNQARKAVCP